MKFTLTFIVELIIMFVGIAIFIVLTSSLFQTFFEGAGSLELLGFFPTDKCKGSLSLSSSGTGNCMVKAQILTSNCFGKKYQIKENNCFGPIRCEDTINYEYFQATCGWFTMAGKKNYVLCVDNSQKDSAYAICK